MKEQRMRAPKTKGLKLVIFLGTILFTVLRIGNVFAAGNDFVNTDFTTAAPYTYDHTTGGGAYNDRTVGNFNDITEQLVGSQFTCGDIVTYLLKIEVADNPVHTHQTIEMDVHFLGNSTGQSGAGLIDIVGARINYGMVENGDNGTGINPGPGAFGIDSGINDDGDSTATIVSETFVGTPYQPGAELLATIRIDNLEAGEKLVLRIDVSLGCDAGTSPTGNLQGQLDAARVIVADGQSLSPPDVITTGQQSIPILKIGDITGSGEALLSIEKTVTTSEGTCGVDDVASLSVAVEDTVKYCYTVSNPGTADLFDIEVVDDNGTPGNSSDDFTVTLSGLQDLDGQGDLGDLAGGATITGEALVTLHNDGIIVNTASATGNNGLSGGYYQLLADTDTAEVIVAPAPQNPPVANNDSATTEEDAPVTINVAANDTDRDGNLDPYSVVAVNFPFHGALTNNGDGTFTYAPNPDFNGTDSFSYKICDTDGLCGTATATITVTPVNDPPNAKNDATTINQDIAATIKATANDTDVDGNLDPSTASVVGGPANGTVTNHGDGTLTYVPASGFSGSDSFDYQVCDTEGLCDTATVAIAVIEVVPVNHPPVAADDTVSSDEDISLNINAVANDSDVDGNLNPSSTAVVSAPSNGTLINNGDGTFTYTSNENYNGTDSFDYRICDTDGLCNTATVTITVNPVNDPPMANDDHATTPEDTPVTIPSADNDSDQDGNLDPFSVIVLGDPSNGSIINNWDGTFSYTPNKNYNGTDGFDYRICDTDGLCDTATVTIAVNPVNDPPVADDDNATTSEDTPVTIPATANDSDVDGNLDASSATVTRPPSNGSMINHGDGTFTYTPDKNYNGTDGFDYQICDTDGLCDTATVTITVDPVNDQPVAGDDSYSILEDMPLQVPAPGILGNDYDIDGDFLSVTLLSGPAHGAVTQNTDGSFTYTPNWNYYGTDTCIYQACDSENECDDATVTIYVGAENDPPVANDNVYSIDEDTELTVPLPGVLGNDSDVDGDPLTVNLITPPAHGTLTQNPDGSFAYTPNPDFNGSDHYIYQACDPLGECNAATVTMAVNPVNDPPVAADDAYSTKQDTPLTVNAPGLLSNDNDIDSDTLVVDGYDAASEFGGTVVVDSYGGLTYTPATGFAGIDMFTYTIADGNGEFASATASVTVEAKNNRSISVAWEDWALNSGTLGGSFTITNMSGGYDVQIQEMDIEVQYRLPGGGGWTYVAVNGGACSFDPEPMFLVVDQQSVSFANCQMTEQIPADATVRVTANVKISGRNNGKGKADGWFLDRLSK
jgi:hypothetical protein